MMTVRFSTGFSIQYNTAAYVDRNATGFADLYTKKDGKWIAQVPITGCVIEGIPACRNYFAADPATDAAREVKELRHKLELANRRIAKLKGATDAATR